MSGEKDEVSGEKDAVKCYKEAVKIAEKIFGEKDQIDESTLLEKKKEFGKWNDSNFNSDDVKKIIEVMMDAKDGKVDRKKFIQFMYCLGPPKYIAKTIRSHFWDARDVVDGYTNLDDESCRIEVQKKPCSYVVKYADIDTKDLDGVVLVITRSSERGGKIQSARNRICSDFKGGFCNLKRKKKESWKQTVDGHEKRLAYPVSRKTTTRKPVDKEDERESKNAAAPKYSSTMNSDSSSSHKPQKYTSTLNVESSSSGGHTKNYATRVIEESKSKPETKQPYAGRH